MWCEYYEAEINLSEAWFIVAILKSFDHLAFDRAFKKNTFEFFVPERQEKTFVDLMNYLKKEGKVFGFTKKENRLILESELV